MISSRRTIVFALFSIHLVDAASQIAFAEEPFRPEPGKFAPFERAKTYRGELAFVDHANRRGSVRIQGSGIFRTTAPHPFALLPYGMVRYHRAPADLRDIPLGSILHISAFLPPDPKVSAVPVLPPDPKDRDAAHRPELNVFPAENHALLVEDEISYCERMGMTWKLRELELQDQEGMLIATLEPQQGSDERKTDQKLTFDLSTRIWRGRECLTLADLIAEGSWPSSGRKILGDQPVRLNLKWKPTPGGVFMRYHISDLWLDDEASARAAQQQTANHVSFMRSRWLPGWVDAVEYGKFGRAKVSVTLFGGMDPSLYADFIKGIPAMMNGVENTLKHTEAGSAGPSQMAARGSILDVTHSTHASPRGSSGVHLTIETDLITEGIRPTKVVRIRPAKWPDVHLPREEYIDGNAGQFDERFPSPSIFPRY